MHNSSASTAGAIETESLTLAWQEAPWDSRVFGFPVLQVANIRVNGARASIDIGQFNTARDELGAGLVSCRLPHDRLTESMLLEDQGFRFIEMVYQPEMPLANWNGTRDETLSATIASERDLAEILEIASSAFHNERFHMDPRLDKSLGDVRYCNWIRSSYGSSHYRLYAIRERGELVAFFMVETQADGCCYWHLTAVAPNAQGRGYGKRTWKLMMALAKNESSNRIRTCIAARNHRVLNLYVRLGFHFPPPLMTFHWVR